ncbi:MAG: hypothetical protein MN733_07955 [Nitrososphaera sp.]|nr:hypothetical protein [Nitrososphaera sp.]MCI0648285.1 hypothetical protein [Chloroflexota bacterium]
MHRYVGYALMLIAVLTVAVWAFSKYVQPILPASFNNDLVLLIAGLLGVAGLVAAFKDAIELFSLLSHRNSGDETKTSSSSVITGPTQIGRGTLAWHGDVFQEGSTKIAVNNSLELSGQPKSEVTLIETLIRDIQKSLYGDDTQLPYVLTLSIDLCERIGLSDKYVTWLTKELTGYEDYDSFQRQFDNEELFEAWMENWAPYRLVRPYVKFQYLSQETGQLVIDKWRFVPFIIAHPIAEVVRKIHAARDRGVREFSMPLRNVPEYYAQVVSFAAEAPIGLEIPPDLEVFHDVSDLEKILNGVRERILWLLRDARQHIADN